MPYFLARALFKGIAGEILAGEKSILLTIF
jgi:hypothetical protein